MAKKRGQHEGSVYKRGDGIWCAVVPSRHSPTGKRLILYGSRRDGTNTRDAVARRLHEYLAGRPGVVLRADQETVESFLKRWLAHLEDEGELRPKTVTSYSYTATLINASIGGIRLQALQPEHVRQLMRRLKDEGRAPRTVSYSRSVLGIALAFAVAEGIVTRNVASREVLGLVRQKAAARSIKVISAALIAKILDVVNDAGDRLLLKTVATFGLRIGEALGLRWRDVDFESKTLRITAAAQRQPSGSGKGVTLVPVKTINSRRTLLVYDGLLAELKAHRAALLEQRLKVADRWEDHDLIFPSGIGTPRDARNVLRVFHRAQLAAGVAEEDVASLHRLRHSAATFLLGEGVPLHVVSSILGHANISVTKSFYAAFTVEQQAKASAAMAGAFGLSAK